MFCTDYEPPSLCHFEALAAVPAVLGTAGGAGAAAAGGGFLSSILPAVGAIGSLGGTVLSAKSSLDQADYENKVAQANNVALQAKANQDAAAAQRQEVTQQRQTQLALSREQALAGASGGSATDPTVLNLSKQIVQQGGYNALSAAYNGQAAANADIYQGNIDLFKGQQAVNAAPMTALGTVLGGIGRFGTTAASLYKSYIDTITERGPYIPSPLGNIRL